MTRVLSAQQPDLDTRLGAAIRYASLEGGKRVRPVLVYASAEALGADRSSADAAACAVEFIHCYSLVHDDLPAMDDDDLRRGRPTVHKAFDEATAILAGDALLTLAFECLSATHGSSQEPAIRLQMLNRLAIAAGNRGMVAGQAIDFALMGQTADLDRLETMHRLKTGALIRCSVELGALSAPAASPEQLRALSNYADAIGLAFQVQDDILDVSSDTVTLGKQQGADQALNKPTYVSMLGLDAAVRKADELTEQALAALKDFDQKADPLRHLANYITSRKS
ncbi:MAG: polyprenyl synthetase family protein [Pseudomonadales bacterium]|nr:polyprenyl synthetase family protein [Pseudomonadales bacterium]